MKLVVKNGFLIDQNKKKFRCSIGYNGLSKNKSEGDGCTPIGNFKINKILYRPDKLSNYEFNLKSEAIERNDGWCDDINSDLYNQKVSFPFAQSAEHLHRDDDLYDIICVIDYNLNPIVKGRGSAIFLHVAKEDYSPTHGCVAIKKEQLLKICLELEKNSTLKIEY